MTAKRNAGELLRFFTPELPDIAGGLKAHSLASLVYLENVGERLTALAPDGSTRLKALEAVSMSLDGLTFRLTLRKGLHFHCGAEVTAGDAVETILRTLRDKASASQLHLFVAKDKAQRHGFALYAVSRYRFELKLVHRMPDFLARLSLPELSLRHDGGTCFNGLWKMVEQDTGGLLLSVHLTHPQAETAPYREIRWERLAKDPELKGGDEAFIYLYAGTQLKSPPDEVLADEIVRPLGACLSFLIELDGPSGVCGEVRTRIVRATRARFSRNSLWKRMPLIAIAPKGHVLHTVFPDPPPETGPGRRYRLALSAESAHGVVPPRIWEEFQRVAGADFGLDVDLAVEGEGGGAAPDVRATIRMVYHAHPADYFTPIAQLAAGRYDLAVPADGGRTGQLPRAYADFCQALARSARLAPFLNVPFVLRSNRNVRQDETTGLFYFADVRQSSDRLRKNRMKESTLKVLGQALQMFVHDVKRPFSMVQGILTLLESAQSPDRLADLASRYLPDVRKAVGSVDRLIEDILEIGSDSEPNREDVAVSELLSGVLRELFALDRPKNLVFSSEFAHKHKLRADPRKLSRVASNIVANAAEAMKHSGKIWFATTEDLANGMVTVTIGNTNSYIPPEMIGGIFDRFFTEGKKRGTGLGLAIVKKIVLDHGGDVWCVSDREAGTRFHFTIPASEERDTSAPVSLDAPVAERAARAVAVARPGQALLLVEDDPLYVEVIQSILAADLPTFSYESARNADDAFALAKARRFAVAIVDVDLGPHSENGLALVKRLRALDPAMRICVHSDGAPFELQRLVVEAGGDLFLPKPMAKEHLMRLLQAEPRPSLKRIAVIDDDALMLESWEALPGYAWRGFESPRAFLAACDADEALLPSLWCVVTDQSFDGADETGTWLAGELVARRPGVPVFLASNLRKAPESAAIVAAVSKDAVRGIKDIEAWSEERR